MSEGMLRFQRSADETSGEARMIDGITRCVNGRLD
jgi:hypothetical protein